MPLWDQSEISKIHKHFKVGPTFTQPQMYEKQSREKNKAAVEMDGGRRRCRCGVGCGGAEDNVIMNTIMLRFRPIAPKPTSIPRKGEYFPGGGIEIDSGERKTAGTTTYRRQKRKYVRASSKNKQKRETTPPVDNREKKIVTLQLLPEGEEGATVNREGKNENQLCLDLNDNSANNTAARRYDEEKDDNSPNPNSNNPLFIRSSSDRDAMVSQMTMGYIMECWVTAECVMDTCMERVITSIGCTDEEIIRNLDQDTCPGFVSNGFNTVEWVNRAFKGMMTAGDDFPTTELMVWLVVTEKMMSYLQESKTGLFTCRVRLVQNTSGKERFSMTLPCDTWRMDGGRFAWRLDVKAALSLGQNLKPYGT